MTDTGSPSWYVVQTHPHAEAKAASHLERQAYGIYLPRYLKRRRHARRIETVAAALFPRYLFVAVDRSVQGWRSITGTVGVSRLVCNGDEPAVVDSRIINALRRREGSDGYVQLDRKRFQPGDRVQIADGAFGSCLGLFEGMRDDERVTVLLDLLGRKVRVVIDELLVTAA